MKITNLADTVNYMTSSDYKERFIAEYAQLKIRRDKLRDMLEIWDKGSLSFTPTCPRHMYNTQIEAMDLYLAVLAERAKLEDVELPSI